MIAVVVGCQRARQARVWRSFGYNTKANLQSVQRARVTDAPLRKLRPLESAEEYPKGGPEARHINKVMSLGSRTGAPPRGEGGKRGRSDVRDVWRKRERLPWRRQAWAHDIGNSLYTATTRARKEGGYQLGGSAAVPIYMASSFPPPENSVPVPSR